MLSAMDSQSKGKGRHLIQLYCPRACSQLETERIFSFPTARIFFPNSWRKSVSGQVPANKECQRAAGPGAAPGVYHSVPTLKFGTRLAAESGYKTHGAGQTKNVTACGIA